MRVFEEERRCSLERTKLLGSPKEDAPEWSLGLRPDTHSLAFAAMKCSLQSIRFKGILSLCKLWMFTMFFVSRWWWNTGKGSKGTTFFKLHTITSSFLPEAEGELWKHQTKKIDHGWKPRRSFLKYVWLWNSFLQYTSSTPKLHPFIPCLAWLQFKEGTSISSHPFLYLSQRDALRLYSHITL